MKRDHRTPELSPIVHSACRSSTLGVVGSLFVFSMFATFLFATTSGPVRLPTAAAALLAPWVSHRVLTRQVEQGPIRRHGFQSAVNAHGERGLSLRS
jgi:hypothetical protein